MKNVIAYLRVSTDNQVGEDKYGLDVQRKDIDDYCSRNDYNVVEYMYEEGISGGKLNRPMLDRLLSGDTGETKIDAVVIAKTDRISRDVQLYYFIKLSLAKKNIELLSVQEDYESFGMMATLMEAMVIAFAEFERQMITSRTSNGRIAKAKTGGYSGGKPPYGYTVYEGKLVVNEEQSQVVTQMFDLRSEGMSFRKIAELLNEYGMFTTTGSKWYATQVKYIIDNEKLYRGYYKYGNDEWVQGIHEAILK